MIQISVIDEATVLATVDLAPLIAALQRQVSGDFAPAWGIDARLNITVQGGAPSPAMWQLVLLDDSDQADALGYHETTAAGLPLGKVFVRTSRQDGESWTVCASHELLEMLADPWICESVLVQTSAGAGTLYPKEVCDAVEGASYPIDGIAVSDFVLPSYWFPGVPGVTPVGPFDHLGKLAAPLPALLPGGYLSEMTVGVPSTGWQQIADLRRLSARHAVRPGSRRHRRMIPSALWRRSTKG